MGTITEAFETVFRDFVTTGVSSSGLHEPEKSDIRPIGAVIEQAIGNTALGTMIDVTKDTAPNLAADLAHAANSVALVYADPTDANNDLWLKVGASGSGSWTNTGILHAVIAGVVGAKVDELVQPLVEEAEAAAEESGLQAGIATTAAGSINLPALLATASDLPFLTTLSDDQSLILMNGSSGYRTSLKVLKKWLGLFPVPVPAGDRVVIDGDSRSDNGLIAQAGNGLGMTSGVAEAIRLQGIHGWLLRKLNWPMQIVGQWTFGGSKTSESCHDHALAVKASRDPHLIIKHGVTNDGVDYTGSGGLGTIELGDPDADPATLPRVGDRRPSGTGLAAQGTTLGNLDKEIRYWDDGVANGLGRSVPFMMFEQPTENPGRRGRNRAVHEWLQKHAALGTYPNLIAPNIYPLMLEDPDMINGPVTSEVVRRDLQLNPDLDLYPDGIAGAAGDNNVYLHQNPDEALFMGEAIAEDAAVVASLGSMPSLVVLPDGTNNASFINTNPTISVGDGSGVKGYSGSSSPAPTGTVAQGWSLGHSVTTGSIAIAASFNGDGDQVIAISRTGGSSPGTARTVELRGTPINITPVAGKAYACVFKMIVPARDPNDLFTVFPHIYFNEPGLVDDYGQDISTGTYGAFAAQNPNYFPHQGATLIGRGVPLEITPAMVASATGTIQIEPRISIVFDDVMNTSANGVLQVVTGCLGIVEYTLDEPHVAPPAVPAAGPYFTAAPSISGSLFVGGTITLSNGTLSAGSVTNRRLLRNGSPVTFTGSSYTLSSGDLGATFVFEVTGTSGGTVVGVSAAFGPIAEPPAELVTLIDALDGNQNNAIFDFTTAAVISTVYTANDLSGNGNPALQSASVRYPGISTTLGAVMDGSNDCAGYPWQTAAPTSVTVVMAMRKDVGASGGRLLSDGTTSNQAGFYNSGSTTALVGTWTVDGVSVTTGGALYTALNDGLEHIVKVKNLTVSTWPALFFSRLTGALMGSIRRGVSIDQATASLSAAEAAAEAWVALD